MILKDSIFLQMTKKDKYQLQGFILLLLLSLCSFYKTSNAQQPAYINYTMKDGLPSNTVYCIFQDSKGYVWLGTDRGVVRYDAYHFTTYTTSDGLADNMIFDIYEDSKGRIWFACNNGNACYYYGNKFFDQKNNRLLALINNQGPGLKTLEDREHNIVLLTHFNLYKISPDDQVTELYKNESKLFSSISLNEKGEVLVLESDAIININTRQVYPFDIVSPNAPQLQSKSMVSRGTIYHTQRTDIVSNRMEGGNLNTEVHTICQLPYMTQSIIADVDHTLLVGTQNGLYRWDESRGEILSHSFNEVSVSGMLRDREGNLWVSSLNKGLFLSINSNIRLLNTQSGLGFDYCSFVDKLADGSIAFGSNAFQLALMKDHDLKYIQMPKQFGEGKVEKIRLSRQGDYYATLGSVMIRINARDFTVKVFTIAARDILFQPDNKVLMVAGNSLREIDNANALNTFDNQSEKAASDTFVNIVNIKANGLYKGKYSGNIYLYGLFGVRQFVNDHIVALPGYHSFLSKNIYRVQETSDRMLWLASNIFGVLVIRKGQLFVIDQSKGLASNFINAIYADSDDRVWVASVAGLSKITYSTQSDRPIFTIENFSKADGLVTQNVNDVIKDGDDIYVATEEGVCLLSEADLHLAEKQPLINIEGVYFNNMLQAFAGDYYSDYQHNSVKIKFAGIFFRALGNLQYKYRMKGLETHWNYTRNTILEYPALSPGHYTFEVMAVNPKGINSPVQSVEIHIQPPFWATWWFVVPVALLFILLLIFLLQKQFARIKKRHKIREQLLNLENEKLETQKQQAVYEKELSEIKHQALRLHMNPHFIFNAINAIQGFYASGDVETARTYIGKFSGLLRLILDQSRKEFISISEEVTILRLYLDLNTLRFEDKFTYELSVDQGLLDNNEEIPPMLIQPFVENAINHGIAPLKTIGKISVRIADDHERIRCEIEDNGVGREFSYQLNKDRPYQSTGIAVTRKRIELLNAQDKLTEEEQFRIIDLYDAAGNACGTKIIFHILKSSL